MKNTIVLLSAALLSAVAAHPQLISQEARQRPTQYLEQTRDGVTAAVKGLSDAQLKFKSAPDRWSVAETLEHIAKAEDFIFQNVTVNVMKAPAPRAGRDNAKIDAFVLAVIP